MKTIQLAFIGFLFLTAACGTDDDTKGISSKIVGNWKLTKYLINNGDSTSAYLADYPSYQMQFAANNTVKEVYSNPNNGQLVSAFGLFELSEDETEVEVSFNGEPIQTAVILQLDDNALRYKYRLSGDSIERRFSRVQ